MQDEVDEVVAAWRAVRPDLELGPLQVLSRVRRLADLLDQQRLQAFAQHGLQIHEFDVLAALRRAAEELTPGQLLDATHVTSGTMTNRLDRLERRGLVTRRPHPGDGRQTLVGVTDDGRERVDGALSTLLGYEAALVEQLPAAERTAIVGALRTLLAHA